LQKRDGKQNKQEKVRRLNSEFQREARKEKQSHKREMTRFRGESAEIEAQGYIQDN
jgi:hypothetical protein